jgi:superfamily II DNA or RNA helicase
MMAERGLNTLILVHRRQLMDQWIERLTAFSSFPRDAIGMIRRRSA